MKFIFQSPILSNLENEEHNFKTNFPLTNTIIFFLSKANLSSSKKSGRKSRKFAILHRDKICACLADM